MVFFFCSFFQPPFSVSSRLIKRVLCILEAYLASETRYHDTSRLYIIVIIVNYIFVTYLTFDSSYTFFF